MMENSQMGSIWRMGDQIQLGNFHWEHSQHEQIPQEVNLAQQSSQKYPEQSSQKKDKKGLSREQIQQLHFKKKNLIQFINNIGSIAKEPINRDILKHCQKVPQGGFAYISPDSVVKLLRNRVEKMIKNKRIKKNWSEEDIKILIWVISKYCQMRDIDFSKDCLEEGDWEFIANLIPGVTAKACMFKWLSLKKVNLAENNWSAGESELLNNIVKQYGIDKWGIISQELYLQNLSPQRIYRCPKQCREHWNCYLDPKLKKGPWQRKQDTLLLRAVRELDGGKKWAQIVKLFNGRTENALKNRYNLIMDKQLKENKNRKKMTELQLIQNYLKKHNPVSSAQQLKLEELKSRKQAIMSSNKKSIKQISEIKPYERKSTKRKRRKNQRYGYEQSDEYLESLAISSEEYSPKQYPRQKNINKKHQQKQKQLLKTKPRFNTFNSNQSIFEDNCEVYQFCNPKISQFKQSKQFKEHKQFKDYKEQEHSYHNLFKNIQKQEPIFQQQEEQGADVSVGEPIDVYADMKMVGRKIQDQNGTNYQHFNIDLNQVNVVSLDQAAFQQIREQFIGVGKQIYLCKIDNNQLIKFSEQQQ